jgi:hypothetical protein
VSDFESVDYFTDQSLVPDPYPYFDYLRSGCPVRPATPSDDHQSAKADAQRGHAKDLLATGFRGDDHYTRAGLRVQ